jgi:hypothetical protein
MDEDGKQNEIKEGPRKGKKFLKARFKINGNYVEIPDVEKMTGIMKGIGLTFKNAEEANALLFEFSSDSRKGITSLFCPPFLAIWLNKDNKVLEYKVVSPGKFIVKPQKNFRKLIEVPLNNKYSRVVEFILDKGKV